MPYDRQNVIEETGDLLLERCSEFARNTEEWKRFLASAANVYKYKFAEQVLIYAQNPNVSAVAEQAVWNNRMNRYLKNNAKRIALLKSNPDGSTGLRYVFDIADTYAANNGKRNRTLTEWRITEENESAAAQEIDASRNSFTEAVRARTEQLAGEFAERSLKRMEAYGGLSGELEHGELIEKFRKTASKSAEYIILARCGLNADNYVKTEDLEDIRYFGTYQEISVLGSAVNYMSGNIIRQAEHAARAAAFEQRSRIYDEMRSRGNIVDSREEVQDAVKKLSSRNNRRSAPQKAQISLFDAPETTGINEPETAEPVPEIGNDVIDAVLRLGGNNEKSVLSICTEYSRNKPSELNVEFLKNEYGTGSMGVITGHGHCAVTWNEEGMRLSIGNSVKDNARLVTWEEADRRINGMLEAGNYAPKEVIEQTDSFDRERAARNFWYMHQDVNYDNYPELRSLFKPEWFTGGYPDSTARLAEGMKDAAFLNELEEVTASIAERYIRDADVMRFRLYSPDKVLVRLESLKLEKREFKVNGTPELPKRFLSEDEITTLLIRGNKFSDTRIQNYVYFKDHTSNEERIKYLKEHYGTGGYGDQGYSVDYNSKGMRLRRTGIDSKAEMKWSEVSKRIDRLIAEGKYLTENELSEGVPNYLRRMEEQRIRSEQIQYLNDMRGRSREERQNELPKLIYCCISTIDNTDRKRFSDFGLAMLENADESEISTVLSDFKSRALMLNALEKIQMSTTDVHARSNAHLLTEDIQYFSELSENKKIDKPMQFAVDCIENRVPEIIRAMNANDEMDTLVENMATDVYEDRLGAMRTAVSLGNAGLESIKNYIQSGVDFDAEFGAAIHVEAAENGYRLSYNEYSKFYTDDEMVWFALRAAQAWEKSEEDYQLNYHRQMIESKTNGEVSDGNALSQSEFIIWASSVISEDRGVKNSYDDITKYYHRVRRAAEYQLCSLADERSSIDGYTLKDIAPFFGNFVDSENMREQTYQLIADNVYDILSQNRENEIIDADSITVVIRYSEHPAIADAGELSYALADKVLAGMDEMYAGTGGYFPTDFEIHAVVDGETFEYEGTFDIGGENGGLTAHIKASYEYYLSEECEYVHDWKERGEYESITENLRHGQDILVPYLEQHTELTREETIKLNELTEAAELVKTAELTETAEPELQQNQYQPLYRSYLDLKAEHENDILLFRMGDFYELFNDDAVRAAEILKIETTQRIVSDTESVTMCGFPTHIADTYIDALTSSGINVAVAEPDESGRREVVRVAEANMQDSLTVKIGFSEHPAFYYREDGRFVDRNTDMSFALANKLLGILDMKQNTERETKDIGWYHKTDFEIHAVINGEEFNYNGRFDIGDGDGSLLAHIKAYYDYCISPESPINIAWKNDNPEEYAEKIESLKHAQEVLLPYLEQHTELTQEENKQLDAIMATEHEWFAPYEPDEKTAENEAENTEKTLPESEQEEAQHIDVHYEKSEERTDSEKTEETITETAPEGLTELDHERNNFRIENDMLGQGTAGEKYKWNIEAIKTLKKLETEQRPASHDEQEIMSRYVGWGGLSECFKEGNSKNSELKSLLTEEEYNAARESTLSAFYTSPVIIKSIYAALSDMGLREGNILEPSCGVGSFFGLIPEEMSKSKLYGVELDSISGRIAQKLYPDADIRVQGFEETDLPDNLFDAAVGNVPFGQFKVPDRRYDKHNFLIHDYFIAKTLDKLRAGGIAAVIVPKGVMDKKNPSVRRYIAQRADLIGAVRLPNDAFKANAGTEAIADILFLQKRDRAVETEPEWVYLGKTEDGLTVNNYFAEHPEMVLGRLEQGVNMYGREDVLCVPYEKSDLSELLTNALKNLHAELTEYKPEKEENGELLTVPASPDVRNYSYAVLEGEIYFREDSVMIQKKLPKATSERVKGMIELRECMRELIDMQLNDVSDEELKPQQAKLNEIYDTFTKKYGLINGAGNRRAFNEDGSYPLLSSLENLDDEGKLKSKADIFTKRTVQRYVPVEHTDTAAEALAVSVGEKARVDIPFMCRLTGFGEDKIISDLNGIIYPNPAKPKDGGYIYETADEYLSGNVREKLNIAEFAAKSNPIFEKNVQALTTVIPPDLKPGEIDVKLGAAWIDTKYIDQFIYDTFKTPLYRQYNIKSKYSPYTSEWSIEGKRLDFGNTLASVTYGTERVDGYQLLENSLNLRETKIYDTKLDNEGKERRVINQKETTLARQKQELIKREFKDWIFKDPDRSSDIVRTYNDLFNSVRPREYDGSHLVFPGMNPEITMRTHQLNAVAHTLYGKNTLLAHEVGAGKTYEMVASAMESKRLGLCHKSMFVVPNMLTEQMGADILKLYPSANVLVASKKDFTKARRRRLCARIATGDFDIVVIGHSQLEKIPISQERQERYLNDRIDDITEAIAGFQLKEGQRFQIKQLEKMRRNLRTRLTKLAESPQRDDTVTFEELGVDRLYVDEAHGFKNLYFYTKMNNVSGLSQSEAQKSADLQMKCQYMDELTGGRGLVFATATPVSNSMTEIYTMMRYLQADTLTKMGWQNFDAWAANFGETVTKSELAPEGSGYRERTRFAKFSNLPELMSVFKECADIKTADMLDLSVPKANFHNIAAEPTEIQKDMVAELSERAGRIHDRKVSPSEDNMLNITTDGRKIGLDQRLINPELPDEPGTKVNLCIENVFNIWEKTADKRSTQLVFCDYSTPGSKDKFNLYDDIKSKLVAKGIPEHEIAFIHDANTDMQKSSLFSKVKSGNIRILIGSTSKCGVGMNVQDKLIALHDLDCPWRPADLQQRMGRIVRQGNENKEVDIFRYVTKSTFDAYLWQTIENKQRFISQIMTSKNPVRACEDADEATLSYAEVKALCAGDERIKEKMDLEIEVSKLQISKANYQNEQFVLKCNINDYPAQIAETEKLLAGYTKDREVLQQEDNSVSAVEIAGTKYTDEEEAGKALQAAAGLMSAGERSKVGSFRGFDIFIRKPEEDQLFYSKNTLILQKNMSYSRDMYAHGKSNIQWLFSKLNEIEESGKECIKTSNELNDLKQRYAAAKEEYGKPFPYEAELNEKLQRLEKLDEQLNMDNPKETEQPNEEQSAENVSAEKKEAENTPNKKQHTKTETTPEQRPSLRERLRQKKEIVAGQKSKHGSERGNQL
ncbi:MAG: SNF2-related protein [bacterium]|nr:SNF2-related protein [bacterium]